MCGMRTTLRCSRYVDSRRLELYPDVRRPPRPLPPKLGSSCGTCQCHCRLLMLSICFVGGRARVGHHPATSTCGGVYPGSGVCMRPEAPLSAPGDVTHWPERRVPSSSPSPNRVGGTRQTWSVYLGPGLRLLANVSVRREDDGCR